MKRLVLTGGGTAGHVTPHLALIPHLEAEGYELHYIGTSDGIERELIPARIPYYAIAAGKLRRYFDWRNLTDPFRVLKGIGQAWRILRKVRPAAIFSKGGFVTVPVAAAGWMLGIPVLLHESDYSGLRMHQLLCTEDLPGFPETSMFRTKLLSEHPIRKARHGSGCRLNFAIPPARPTLLVMEAV